MIEAVVVISPAMTAKPVVTRVSQATRPVGSYARIASRTASEIWSAILSGWPSVTDSDVKRKFPLLKVATPYCSKYLESMTVNKTIMIASAGGNVKEV